MPAVQCILLLEAIIHMLSSSCVPVSPSAAWSAKRESSQSCPVLPEPSADQDARNPQCRLYTINQGYEASSPPSPPP